MTKLALLTLTFVSAMCAQFTPDASTRLSYSLPAFSRGPERKIEAESIYLDTYSRRGQPMKRHLLVAFDPVSRYFLFRYTGMGLEKDESETDPQLLKGDAERTKGGMASYVSDHGIFLAEAAENIISLLGSSEKAASIQDAEQQAIKELSEHVLEATKRTKWPVEKVTRLQDSQGSTPVHYDFYTPANNPAGIAPVNVVSLAEVPQGWEITLQGQYRVRTILSADIRLLKVERIDPPKQ